MKFLVDDMLGRLAQWLRILGFDACYAADLIDQDLVRIALQEDRIVLTRDTHLAQRFRLPQVFLVKSSIYWEQLKEVLGHFGLQLDWQAIFTRCLRCNCPIQPIRPEEVLGQVPPYVAKTQPAFYQCPQCKRIYWRGTHFANTVARLKTLLSD